MNAGPPLEERDDVDDHVDDEIAACLNLTAPRSFFLFAGAGSGKTRSLVTALQHVQRTSSERLRVKAQRVGVITFTNAASDEIKRRLIYDPLIEVRTIHSFAWSLIEGLNRDIRDWLRVELTQDLAQLQEEEARGRPGTKASITRRNKITSKTRRLHNLPNIRRFVYSPTGDNRARDALNHAEVLQITAHFLSRKPAMQSILVGRHPILLIDESQDTNRFLVDAFFVVQAAFRGQFTLGLIGDMMQRIYSDGKEGLGQDLPSDWAKPGKKLNYRCPRRIVTLINRIRLDVDHQQQQPRVGALDGFVRLFILPSDHPDKPGAEQVIARAMASITSDPQWAEPKSVKTLTLEHRMAAVRMGFLDIFTPLYEVDSWRTSFLDGTLALTTFYSGQMLPLLKAQLSENQFAVTRILKKYSPLLSQEALQAATDKPEHLRRVRVAIDELVRLWDGGADPSLREILRALAKTNLLEIPESLQAHAGQAVPDPNEGERGEDEESERNRAIEKFLSAPFSQVEPLTQYVSGRAHFDTHQGVKGLEFERVMVIMDDADAKGFMFKYEDLFGGKAAGTRTVDATKRLFYVICSRAKESLALVAYASAPHQVRQFVLAQGWFDGAEVRVGLPQS